MNKHFVIAILLSLLLFLLAFWLAFGSPSEDAPVEPIDSKVGKSVGTWDCVRIGDGVYKYQGLYRCAFDDGLECVVMSGYHVSGITCDWSSDNE